MSVQDDKGPRCHKISTSMHQYVHGSDSVQAGFDHHTPRIGSATVVPTASGPRDAGTFFLEKIVALSSFVRVTLVLTGAPNQPEMSDSG